MKPNEMEVLRGVVEGMRETAVNRKTSADVLLTKGYINSHLSCMGEYDAFLASALRLETALKLACCSLLWSTTHSPPTAYTARLLAMIRSSLAAPWGALASMGLIECVGRVKSPSKSRNGAKVSVWQIATGKAETARTWLRRHGVSVEQRQEELALA